jgi:hypothetical protein
MRTQAFLLVVATTLISMRSEAQWVNEHMPNIPRLANGKANFAAPAPRTASGKPDFSGLWIAAFHPGYTINIAADLDPSDIQPWAAKAFADRMNNLGADDPGTIGCQPLGPRSITGGGGIAARQKLIQTESSLTVLYEHLEYRQIFMDGRTLPKNPQSSYMGYSVGRWEGDVLVVESEGFKATTWLDYGGHPHTGDLHITERYRRVDFGHIQRQITIVDAKTFRKTIQVDSDLTFTPDTELLEYVCAETPRERYQSIGISKKEKAVRVERKILSKYVGAYRFESAAAFGIRSVDVSLSGDQLIMDFNGKGKVPLIPLSLTTFSPRLLGTYEFVMDDRGEVTHLMAHSVEGSYKAIRQPANR